MTFKNSEVVYHSDLFDEDFSISLDGVHCMKSHCENDVDNVVISHTFDKLDRSFLYYYCKDCLPYRKGIIQPFKSNNYQIIYGVDNLIDKLRILVVTIQ